VEFKFKVTWYKGLFSSLWFKIHVSIHIFLI
jgi:hypothetical protein